LQGELPAAEDHHRRDEGGRMGEARQRRDARVLEQRDRRQLGVEPPVELAEHLRHEQRRAPEIEEVIVQAE